MLPLNLLRLSLAWAVDSGSEMTRVGAPIKRPHLIHHSFANVFNFPDCDTPLKVKGYHTRSFRILFGTCKLSSDEHYMECTTPDARAPAPCTTASGWARNWAPAGTAVL